MIVGGSKKTVIAHIAELADSGELNAKAELGDPALSPAESEALIQHFYALRRRPLSHAIRRKLAYSIAAKATKEMRRDTILIGLEKLTKGPKISSSGILRAKNAKVFPQGAIVTSNHFNPLDAILPLEMAKKLGKRLYIVSQETNLALPKPLNFLTNNMDLIPLMKSPHDIARRFKPELAKVLKAGHLVLIYPEEEMWFYYRKPRPCRRGAYQFAAEFGAPIISCFTELRDTKEPDNDEFYKLKYRFHILGVLTPDPSKSARENSIALARADYELKKAAYERIYGQKLKYKFDKTDIAGWRL